MICQNFGEKSIHYFIKKFYALNQMENHLKINIKYIQCLFVS